MPNALDALNDDMARIKRAHTIAERSRKLILRELDACPLGSQASDVLDSLHYELENRVGSLGRAMDELEDEIDAAGTRETLADLKWHHSRVA